MSTGLWDPGSPSAILWDSNLFAKLTRKDALVQPLRDFDESPVQQQHVVYKLVWPDGMGYVGQAKDMSKRMYRHVHGGRCPKIEEWVSLYGWDCVEKQILEKVSASDVDLREAELIKEHGTLWPNGLNVLPGAAGGNYWGIDPERDARLSAYLREKKEQELAKRIETMPPEEAAKVIAKRDHGRKMHSQRKERGCVRIRPNYVTWARKRLEKCMALPDADAHALMRERREKASRRIQERQQAGGYTDKEYRRAMETLECLHPNVFTVREVRAMHGKKGKPPGPLTQASSANKASSRKGQYESSEEE